MNSHHEDVLRMVRRNKLVGIWAAEGLGLVGECAKAYSDDLAMATFDLEGSDVLSKIREDFNAAGVAHSDDQILCVMSQSWLEASDKRQTKRADASDTATVQIARNLQLK